MAGSGILGAPGETPKAGWDIGLVPVVQRHMGSDFAYLVAAAMAATIRQRGGTIRLGTEVLDFRLAASRGFLVETS